jgi:hypothetical protein
MGVPKQGPRRRKLRIVRSDRKRQSSLTALLLLFKSKAARTLRASSTTSALRCADFPFDESERRKLRIVRSDRE